MGYDLATPKGKLTIHGSGFTMDPLGALKGGNLEWKTSAVSELRLEFEDRRCEILRGGQLSCGKADGTEAGTLVSVGDAVFEVRSLEHSADGTLVVEARGGKVAAMKRSERGKGVETTSSVSPTAWVQRVGAWYGLRVHAQDTPVRDQITRQSAGENGQKAETDWDVVQRLASEEGMIAFECDGVLSFGKPSWLVQRPGYGTLKVEIEHDPQAGPRPVDPRIFTRPAPRRSSDSDTAVAEWSVDVDAAFAVGLGSMGFGAILSGYAPQFDGQYLVSGISYPLNDQGTATITCSTPVDPVPVAQAGASGSAVASATGVTSSGVTSPGPGRYGGTALDAQQVQNATTIVKVGLAMGVPAKGLTIALATAMQESTMRNLNYGDRDSLGLFQQRPSQGWGTPQQVQDPAYAARKFFEALLKVNGWQSMSVAAAAQAVQRSAFPDAYAKWQATGEALASAILATAKRASTSAPTVASTKERAIAFARAQIGKPYIWGGTGPAGYDCSGLTQAAYKSVGFDITRTTYTQLANPRLQRVALNDLQAGDLWFPHEGHTQIVSVAAGAKSRVVEAQQEGIPILEGPIWGTGGQGRRVPV